MNKIRSQRIAFAFITKIITTIGFLASLHGPLFSASLSIQVTNGTLEKAQPRVDEMNIIEMAEGMKSLASVPNPPGNYTFQDLPPAQGPMMAQVIYRGVKYNKVVRPGAQDNSVGITVYEVASKQGRDIEPIYHYQIDYYEKILLVTVTIQFVNNSKKTFSEEHSTRGIFLSLPPGGEIYDAMASVGDSSSQVQWIRAQIVPMPGREGLYLIDQPVKPGGRSYQVRYTHTYDGSTLTIPIVNHYTMRYNPILFLSEGLQAKAKGYPLKKEMFQDFGAEGYQLPVEKGAFELTISGGNPMPIPGSESKQQEMGEISQSPPLATWQKVLPIAILLILGALVVETLRKKPAWLQIMRAKAKSKLEHEIAAIESLDIDKETKEKRLGSMRARLERLESSIRG